jgi:hypothetical protein
MHLQESNQGFLVCVMVWIYFQMIRSFLQQTSDFGCRTYSCRQRLPFFAVFLVFLKLFSEFQSQILINISSELSHSNSKQTRNKQFKHANTGKNPSWPLIGCSWQSCIDTHRGRKRKQIGLYGRRSLPKRRLYGFVLKAGKTSEIYSLFNSIIIQLNTEL